MPSTSVKLTCSKCGRALKEIEFYKMKTGERCDLCKDCLTQYIDNRNPETFLWILEKFDVPYLERVWVEKTNTIYQKNPAKFGPRSVLGMYLRIMNMTQYKNLTFKDSDHLKAPIEPKEVDPELKRKLEAGEISQAEYDTFCGPASTEVKPEFFKDELSPTTELEQVPAPIAKISETYWTDQLEENDIQYLMLKWGTVYTPQEWITMETMYQRYADEYDMNIDREEVLKKMCKTSLKMDMALDTGDLSGYKNLATVFDQLRKSGKFTEAQNKDGSQKILDSIGEIVALCEKEGGIIPALPQYDPDQYPQDKIDFTIKDLKAYNYNLVVNELGLGDLVESYIEKLERAENEQGADLTEGLVTSKEEQEAQILTDKEAEEFQRFIEQNVEAEAEQLLESMETGGAENGS